MNRVGRHIGYSLVALIVTYCVHWLDVTLVGKVAPAIASSFGQPLPAMTIVLTASRVGLAVGAILGGIAGDRWGRKTVVCVCLGLASLMSLATPLVGSLAVFAILRGASGLLLGGAAPCVLSLVASIAPDSHRSIAVTATLAGASMGFSLGSLMVYLMMPAPDDWRIGFCICGTALAVACILVFWWVTETRTSSVVRGAASVLGLFGAMRATTMVLGVGFFMSMGLNALLASWLPSFFHELADVPVQRFAGIVMYTAPTAVAGMLVAGWLSQRLPRRLLLLLCFGGHGLALVLIGSLSFASRGFIIALAGVSFGQAACQALLNLAIVARYPAQLRATALGGAAAVGRTSGIFAPAIGALAFGKYFSIELLFALLAMVPLIVGALLWALDITVTRTKRL